MDSHRFFRYLISFLVLIINNNIYSQIDTLSLKNYNRIADKIIRSSLEENRGYELLHSLCDIGPRLSGSDNYEKAIGWAKNQLEIMGCDKVWLQPVSVPHWVRSDVEKAEIKASQMVETKELKVIALGGSIGTIPDGVTAKVLEVNDFDELKKRGSEAEGKIVFFSRPLDIGLVDTFAGYGKAVNQRFYGAIESAKYGAVGVIIRSITTKHDNVPHTGVMAYVDSLPKIPAVAVGYLDADFLHDALLKDPNLKLNIKLDCKSLPDVKSSNLIAEITGSEKPEEIIVVGGHLDSWDVGCGAHDDGAGCVQSMEALDLLKRLEIKPKRTIRCVLFNNEENGSRGGTEYGKFADSTNEKHIAAIECDRGGFTPIGFSVESDSSTLIKLKKFLPILERCGINWVKKGGSGADISAIKNIIAKIAYAPDSQRYMDVHHSANDIFEDVNSRELELGSAAITILAYMISEEGL
jgi:carboxypeptidase Q